MSLRGFWQWLFPPSQHALFSIPDAAVSPSDRLGLAFPWGTDTYPALAANGFGVVRIAASWNLIQPRCINMELVGDRQPRAGHC
jgi:hypothetical protein